MTQPIITVENLGKYYKLGRSPEQYQSLRDTLTRQVRRMRRGLVNKRRSNASLDDGFWALNDVSFAVNQGDRLGIIGRNGAGKSTLLKILSRITEPTTGRIGIRGRVASLLEVGTGFHPELSGRENIFLNGAILGMGKAEIRRKFDEIVAFSEIEKFLDTPVKRYSSGMYVRLAFAVAAHLEPEILVVDEVLAVGDMAFQKKCLGKMEEVGKSGRTVLFVSHHLATVERLCTRSLLLNQGQLMFYGSTHEGLKQYVDSFGQFQSDNTHHSVFSKTHRMGLSGARTRLIENGAEMDLEVSVDVTSDQPQQGVGVSIILSTETGVRVSFIGPRLHRQLLPPFKGTMTQKFYFPTISKILAGGTYLVSFELVRPKVECIASLEYPVDFELPSRIYYTDGVPFSYNDFGTALLQPEIGFEQVSPPLASIC
jgi:lipopolysaccharide transport system ATP-binding protein